MTFTTAASLVSGVKLIGPDVERVKTDGSLDRSAGIVKALEQYPSMPYWPGAFVPKLPWETPSDIELDILLGAQREAQPGNWIQIVRVPDNVYDSFEPLRRLARDMTEEKQLERLRWITAYHRAVAEALEYATTLISPDSTLKYPAIYFNSPGLPTVSNHSSHPNLLLGIHTDSLDNAPLARRKLSVTRVCFNVGEDDRFLLYVNLGLEDIARLLKERAIEFGQNADAPPLEPFRRAFMSAFTEYPVMRLRLRPGEGYLAPTENVIHDGSTDGQNHFDIIFMAHGHFQPQFG